MTSRDRMSVVEADITTLDVDAIVNAANEQLAPGGGVCGAIHRAAGPALARDCRALGGCPTGDARITPGHDLKARFVIHAVGPVWRGGGAGEDDLLAAAYGNSLMLARDNGIAVAACARFLDANALPEQVVFCCFGAESAALHRQALADIHPG